MHFQGGRTDLAIEQGKVRDGKRGSGCANIRAGKDTLMITCMVMFIVAGATLLGYLLVWYCHCAVRRNGDHYPAGWRQ